MKIVAQISGETYLVEMGEAEIAAAMGLTPYDKAFKDIAEPSKSGGYDRRIKPGTVFPILETFQRFRAILSHEDTVRKSSATLRALADLQERELPSVRIPQPPAEPEALAPTGDNLA